MHSNFKIPLLIKDQICIRDYIKEKSKLPQLQTIDLNLLVTTFHLLTELRYSSFINSRWK